MAAIVVRNARISGVIGGKIKEAGALVDGDRTLFMLHVRFTLLNGGALANDSDHQNL